MKTTSHSNDAMPTADNRSKVIGSLTITKTETIEIATHPNGSGTYGQMIDIMISKALQNGERISTLTVDIEEEHWKSL